jgi:hypothetical protein
LNRKTSYTYNLNGEKLYGINRRRRAGGTEEEVFGHPWAEVKALENEGNGVSRRRFEYDAINFSVFVGHARNAETEN